MWPPVPKYCHQRVPKRNDLGEVDSSRPIMSFLNLVKIIWSTFKIIIEGSGRKSAVYFLHFLQAVSESALIVLKAHFSPEKFSDFADELELGK